MGRTFRQAAKALGIPPEGPVSAFHGKPEGAKTVDPARAKEAAPSRPVLPQSHPLLEATPNRYPETWVEEAKGLSVYGPTVAVVGADGRLWANVSVEWGRKAEENWTFRRLALPKPQALPGRALVLASTGGDTYFHWMTDVLPRIRLVREAGLDPASFDHVLVNGTEKPFQRETLERLGIPRETCRSFFRAEAAYLCERAVLPSLPGTPGVVTPETTAFLRGLFPFPAGPGDKKLFFGRRDARHRALVEEAAIAGFLQARGFETADCSRLSVREQAELFGSTGLVVIAHGAAATNLAFCRPGTRVLELFGPDYVNPCYRDLCVAADLRHAAVIGKGRDWNLYLPHDRPSAPITAGSHLMEKVLDEWGC